jgi:hypothetical protein
MIAFEIVTIGVAVIGAGIGTVNALRRPGPLDTLGRNGQSWFHHTDSFDLSERASDDEHDAPIPRRRLRGRPF